MVFGYSGIVQAAEPLLTKSEIVQKRQILVTSGATASLRHKSELCPTQPDAQSKKACEVAYDWLHTIAKVLIAQLDTMEVLVEMDDSSPLKSWLRQTMSVERLNAELEMAKYRAYVITTKFDPRNRQTALEKK